MEDGGLGSERVSVLRQQAAAGEAGLGAVLVVGRRRGGIERWVGDVAGPNAGELLAGSSVPVRLGSADVPGIAPASRLEEIDTPGPALALVTDGGEIPAEQRLRLNRCGCFGAAVLVMRLSAAFHEADRALARSLRGMCYELRALLVALPGEELTPRDAADVEAYAAAKMAECGFVGSRDGGVHLHFAAGGVPPSGVVAAEAKTLLAAPPNADAHAVFRSAAARVARDAAGRLPRADEAVRSGPDAATIEREARERGLDAEAARRRAWEDVFSWTGGASGSRGGIWLRYNEQLCPGLGDALVAEAKRAATELTITAAGDAAQSEPQELDARDRERASTAPTTRASRPLWALAFALAGGALGAAIARLMGLDAVSRFAVPALSLITLVAGGAIGWSLGPSLLNRRSPALRLPFSRSGRPDAAGSAAKVRTAPSTLHVEGLSAF